MKDGDWAAIAREEYYRGAAEERLAIRQLLIKFRNEQKAFRYTAAILDTLIDIINARWDEE